MDNELTVEHLKRRILVFVIIVLAAIVAVSAWSVVAEYRNVVASAERQTAGYAHALSEHAESAFAEADRIVKDVIHEVKLHRGLGQIGGRELYDILHRLEEDAPQVGALFMVDSNGTMFINSSEFPSRQIDVSDREYFRHYLENSTAGLYISKPVMSRLVNRWRFNLIRPLNKPGEEFAGILAVAFEVGYFRQFFSSSSLGPHGRIMLIRDDGAPLVYEPEVPRGYQADFRKSILFRDWLPRVPSGTFHVQRSVVDNSSRIVSYKRLSRFPVVAVVSLDQQDTLGPWTRKAVQQGAVTGGICLVIVLLTRLMFRHLDRLETARSGLREQQELVRIKAAQIDAANDAILQVDSDGRLVHFNQALCQITGRSARELAGVRLADLEPPEYAGHTEASIRRVTEQGTATFDSAYLKKGGGVVPVEVHARRMEGNGTPFILGIVRDVSERKRAEAREQARLAILEEMATGAELTSLLGHIVMFVEQQSPGALCSVLLADETGTQLRHGAGPSLPEAYNMAVDGLRIAPGMGSCGTAAWLKQRVVVEDIENHPSWKGFLPARQAGLRACWSQPVLSADGELLGTFAVYYRETRLPTDSETALVESASHLASIAIGRSREEERRASLEERLSKIQRIEAIGQLAGGVAHDFNNLLTPILVYADLLRRELPGDGPHGKMAENVLKAGHKARELTQKLLSFGRRQMLTLQPMDLNEIILTFNDILRSTVRENIAINLSLAPGGTAVMADRGQIEQILLNLAVNAQDAIDGSGSISIETGHLLIDDEYARQHPGMRPGRHVLLAFTDTGCGMADETLKHIFEPFFTTKQVGHGTGLGLATVYGVVKQHDGYITVVSRPGSGTTFRIYLPAKNELAASAPEETEPGGTIGRLGNLAGSTVLLAEDNRMVRDMARELLQGEGCRVLAAETPGLALEFAGAPATIIDLLVTDVVMPGMNGMELYERLLETRPGLPVLFMSGYTNNVVVHNGSLEEGVCFLQKPFTREQFLEKVCMVLGKEGAVAKKGEE